MRDADNELISLAHGALKSNSRVMFLGALADEITIAGRANYVAAGNSEADAARTLTCLNELLIVVIKQIRQEVVEPGVGYPDAAFLEVLQEKAKGERCERFLLKAMHRALGPRPYPGRGYAK